MTSKLRTTKTKVKEVETIARTKIVTSTRFFMTDQDVVAAVRAWVVQEFPGRAGLEGF